MELFFWDIYWTVALKLEEIFTRESVQKYFDDILFIYKEIKGTILFNLDFLRITFILKWERWSLKVLLPSMSIWTIIWFFIIDNPYKIAIDFFEYFVGLIFADILLIFVTYFWFWFLSYLILKKHDLYKKAKKDDWINNQ